MLIICFDSQSVVHKEFVPEGKTVNVEFYEVVEDRLLKRKKKGYPMIALKAETCSTFPTINMMLALRLRYTACLLFYTITQHIQLCLVVVSVK
jgi:hypothetical protein